MSQPLIGAPRNRVDGPAKVTGSARYTHDVTLEGMLHAVVVTSTIANGRIRLLDDSRARQAQGVVDVMTHRNAPRVNPRKDNPFASHLFLLQDDAIQFDRQPVAVVIADSFERALYAAQLVSVEYQAQPPVTRLSDGAQFLPKDIFGEPATHERGTPQAAFAAAPVQVRQTYRTPTEHHNPMESHATCSAAWLPYSASIRNRFASSCRSLAARSAAKGSHGRTSRSPQWPPRWWGAP